WLTAGAEYHGLAQVAEARSIAQPRAAVERGGAAQGRFPSGFQRGDDGCVAIDHEPILDVGIDHLGHDLAVARLGTVERGLNDRLDLLDGHSRLWPGVYADSAAVRDHRRPAGKKSAIDAADRDEELGPDEVLHLLRDIREVLQSRQLLDH